MPNTLNSLHKSERICSKNDLDRLFAQGHSALAYPVRVVYLIGAPQTHVPAGASVLFVASKRQFKHAVDRNRLKRLMREAYRLSKTEHPLNAIVGDQLFVHIAFQNVSKEMPTQKQVTKGMNKVLDKIEKELHNHIDNNNQLPTDVPEQA